MLKRLLMVLVIALLIGCNQKGKEHTNYEKRIVDGVENVINNSQPLYAEFKLDTTLTTTINYGDSNLTIPIKNVSDISVDSKGNIFILDGVESKIHKFNSEGKYIKHFGRNGSGPGEFSYCYSMLLKKDSIYLPNRMLNNIITFNSDGNFCGNMTFNDGKIPDQLFTLGDNYVGSNCRIDYIKGTPKSIKNLQIYDKNLKPIKTIFNLDSERDFTKPFNPTDDNILCATNDKDIIIGHNSDEKYQIDIYDREGNLKQVIRKKFRKILMSKKEIERLNTMYYYNIVSQGKKVEIKFKAKYKKAFRSLSSDKHGRIWVYPARDHKVIEHGEKGYYDIFEDGVNIARATIDKRVLFKNDKIIIQNGEKSIIRVYNY